MRKAKASVFVLALIFGGSNAEPYFPPECPSEGTMEVTRDPSAWADKCFQATNGRLPSHQHRGETVSLSRDIDLDGIPELLEVRGVGNKIKQIYVFRNSDEGYKYLGKLNAHPEFFVGFNSENELIILNFYRAGVNEVYRQQIQYIDRSFIMTRNERMQ